jgi:hypothetical protein
LRTCDLAAFLKPRDFSGPPGFLPVSVRKIPFRKIKMKLHETSEPSSLSDFD